MPQNAEQVVTQNFLRQKWQAENERLEEADDKLNLYMDDYETIIKEKMEEQFTKKNYDRLCYHVNQSQNILKRVINEISVIYKVEASRNLNGKCPRYDELKDQVNFDVKMKRVNRYTNLLNECLIKIGVRNKRIVYDIITPNVCMVLQNDEDPTQADALIYMMTWVNTFNNKEIEYHYWSRDGDYFVYDKHWRVKKVIYEGNSPYKDKDGFILPIVVFHRQEPDYSFWDQDSGRDLYNAAVLTGVKMTLLDYLFKVGCVKQIYIIGDISKIPQNQIMDALQALSVPAGEGASIGVLDMQIDIEQFVKTLTFQINSVINNYGISADQWSLSISEMSGRALKIRNRALMEIREEQIPLYRQNEKELFEKTRIVNNAYPNLFKKIPDNLEFSIDFGEIDFPEDPEDELRMDAKRLKLGLIPPGRLYQKYNPDIKDEAEAEKMLFENLSKLTEATAEHPELDDALNAILRLEKKTESKEGGGAGEE